MIVVGFTGRKRSGKDTAGAALVALGFHRLAFADPLKAMLRALMEAQGAPAVDVARYLEGEDKESSCPYLGGASPRFALQTLGTEWGRQLIAGDLWTGALTRAAREHGRVVVTDIRFPNEVACVRAMGGRVYRVMRPSLPPPDAHASEALVDGLEVDAEIPNTAPSADAFTWEVAAYVEAAFDLPNAQEERSALEADARMRAARNITPHALCALPPTCSLAAGYAAARLSHADELGHPHPPKETP